jgi:hypothetical protein
MRKKILNDSWIIYGTEFFFVHGWPIQNKGVGWKENIELLKPHLNLPVVPSTVVSVSKCEIMSGLLGVPLKIVIGHEWLL